jgi:hypothetical protein
MMGVRRLPPAAQRFPMLSAEVLQEITGEALGSVAIADIPAKQSVAIAKQSNTPWDRGQSRPAIQALIDTLTSILRGQSGSVG